MNEIRIFQNSEFGELEVREIDGKMYFPATECARMLGYEIPRKAIWDHCKGVLKRNVPINGTEQAKNYIPEGDLYRLIVHSRMPAAEQFERGAATGGGGYDHRTAPHLSGNLQHPAR